MKVVCASGPLTKGIDIYHGDMISDVNILAENVSYAYLKAFEYSEDSRFQTRWASMKAHGIIRGAYDFFHPAKDPSDQARSFLNVIGSLDDDDLPCALDWEATDGISMSTDKANALIWLEHVEQETKKTPVIYTAPYFAHALALDERFQKFPLWVAHYDVKCPLVPEPWANWSFWQGSESTVVPGIANKCDLDYFNGSLSDLKTFIAKSAI